jgi:hypothetical protein
VTCFGCDYRKLGPRATGFFEGLWFPFGRLQARWRWRSQQDSEELVFVTCQDEWRTRGMFAFRLKRNVGRNASFSGLSGAALVSVV